MTLTSVSTKYLLFAYPMYKFGEDKETDLYLSEHYRGSEFLEGLCVFRYSRALKSFSQSRIFKQHCLFYGTMDSDSAFACISCLHIN